MHRWPLSILFTIPFLAGASEWPGFRGPDTSGTVPGVRLFDGDRVALEIGWNVPRWR